MNRRAVAASITLAVGTVAVAVPTASAEPTAFAIDFEVEIPEGELFVGANQYESLGVTITDAFGIMPGLSQGDPGGWGLEGPVGPQFVGQNDADTVIDFTFDNPVSSFSIQCAGSGGSVPGQGFAVVALDADGVMVDFDEGTTGEVNEWTTFAVEGTDIASIQVGRPEGTSGFAPFGCDGLNFVADLPDPEPTTTTTTPTSTTTTPDSTTSSTTTASATGTGARPGAANAAVVTPRFAG